MQKKIHILNFDSENTFFLFHTHDFQRSKRGLKCHSMACKHYYALFGSKWCYSTQKNQNGFFQWSGHCAVASQIEKITTTKKSIRLALHNIFSTIFRAL